MTIDKIYLKFKKKYRRALVTGGAGFIGSHICQELAVRGFPVISLDDYSAGKKANLKHLKKYPNFIEVKVDITDLGRLPRFFRGVDIIFHNAASKKSICLKDPRRDLAVNGSGTFNLLELAAKFKIKKFVHASTGSVYGEGKIFPQNENHPTNPVSFYGVSKLAGEKYVQIFHQIYGINTTILRYFHVYGPRQESGEFGGVVAIFIKKLQQGQRPVIFGTGRQQRSFTYVNDVVRANLLTAIKPEAKGQIYNCASGIKVTINELVREIIRAFGTKIKPIYKDWQIGDIKVFDIDIRKIRSLGMDFERDYTLGIQMTIDSMKENLNYEPRSFKR
ncbi:MAG: SDR family NAD(P)-dependent oxidoreductase [Patescibacteria group bacterium]